LLSRPGVYLPRALIHRNIITVFLFLEERSGERNGEGGFEYASGKKHLYKVNREKE